MSQIESWLESIGWFYERIEVASSDASFRIYYRLLRDTESYICMDTSLQKESLGSFLDIQKRLLDRGAQVPKILAYDLHLGYAILEDLGSVHLLDVLNPSNQKEYYMKALDEIVLMQEADTTNLPLYDRDFLISEMELCDVWYLKRHLCISLEKEQVKSLSDILEFIANEVLAQPQEVFVHRDFHSRNIMLDAQGNLGIIDFQDARNGCVMYDVVSLLKDCYIQTHGTLIRELLFYFRDKKGLRVDDDTLIRWFDMVGLQRHIKVLGVFARLNYRDGKNRYLDDMPLTLDYIHQVASKYDELAFLNTLLKIA